jgi:hypothetical protein
MSDEGETNDLSERLARIEAIINCEFKNQTDKLSSLEQKIDMKFALYGEKIENSDKRISELEKTQSWLSRLVFGTLISYVMTVFFQIKVK